MAGQDHTIPWHGARHTIAAVAFGCLILNILSAAPAWAGYLVDLPDGQTVSTSGYWIQGDMLYFAEDRDPVNVYEVQSVRQDVLTEAEMRDREEAMEEVRSLVAGLLGREEAALKGQADLMAGITERETTTGTVLDPKERKSLLSGLMSRARAVEDLRAAWSRLRLPDYSLLLARDIKMLQLMSLDASVEQALAYAESGDPTNREYAWEHLRQAVAFQESFREALPWE